MKSGSIPQNDAEENGTAIVGVSGAKPRSSCRAYRVVTLPGEGIGPEVVSAAVEVLRELSQIDGFSLSIDEGLIGQPALDRFGEALCDETIDMCTGSQGLLFGAVSRHGILELRQQFNFFANLRPVRVSPRLLGASCLRPEIVRGVDILFVRELASGIYFGPSGDGADEQGHFAYHTMHYRDSEIRHIARTAFELAAVRSKRVTVAHKENALPKIRWCQIVDEVAAEFPQVEVGQQLVDSLAMDLVCEPRQFDVVLAGNLFGDILSDLGGAITGSLGMLPSASLNEEGLGLYEPIHGTAPDIAGKGIANPLGAIGSVELMLEQWGETTSARRLRMAQEAVLEDGLRTADLVNKGQAYVTTKELTAALVRSLHRSLSDSPNDKTVTSDILGYE